MRVRMRAVALWLGCCSSMAAAQITAPPAPPALPPAPPPVAVPAPPAAATGKQPSHYVRCDGLPDNISGAETAARLIALSLVVGLLAPQHEAADISKRYSGAEGVAACDAALANETNEVRRAQLLLARAIHHIEAKAYDAAIADAQEVREMRGPVASTVGFRQSLGVSASELQAAALLRAGKLPEAEHAALVMVDESPWDVDNYVHALRYVGLTAPMTPERRAFLDRYTRLRPDGISERAAVRELAGDFAGSADDVTMLLNAFDSFAAPDRETPKLPATKALLADKYALAGQMEKARVLAAQARTELDALSGGAEAINRSQELERAGEALDFFAVIDKLASGDADAARTAFAARSRWFAPGPFAVALLTERLRAGAKPERLTGALALKPESIRQMAFDNRIAAMTAAKTSDAALWRAVRSPISASAYTALARNTWRTDKSKYMITPKVAPTKPTGPGEGIVVTDGTGVPSGQALLLHAALIARARGKTGYMLLPARKRIDVAVVKFGNAGDGGFPPDMTLDAAMVIAGISPTIAEPVK